MKTNNLGEGESSVLITTVSVNIEIRKWHTKFKFSSPAYTGSGKVISVSSPNMSHSLEPTFLINLIIELSTQNILSFNCITW